MTERSRTMGKEARAELAKAFIGIVWMKGKLTDDEKAKSQAIIEGKLKNEKGLTNPFGPGSIDAEQAG